MKNEDSVDEKSKKKKEKKNINAELAISGMWPMSSLGFASVLTDNKKIYSITITGQNNDNLLGQNYLFR